MQEVDILRKRIEKKETELHAWEEKLTERENVSFSSSNEALGVWLSKI